MFDIEFKNIVSRDIGVKVTKRPDMPSPERNIEYITIPGRDGSLVVSDGSYGDITIPVEMNFVTSPDTWADMFTMIKRWLSGFGRLVFSDSVQYFLKCKNVTIDTTYREIIEAGEFIASFLCDPYMYISAGTIPIKYSGQKILNPYSTSKPIYKITGEGNCVLTVNGNSMTANIGQNLTIDTDLMIAYREDGEIQNTAVKGDYEKLYLNEGENILEITSGFDLEIIPNWRVL